MEEETGRLSPESLRFLAGIKANNDKGWFESHRQEYEDCLLKPLRQLAADLTGFMLSIDPYFAIAPGRVVSRIYRDTRFSKDKSPYKSTMWLSFKRPSQEWVHAPAYFLELAADGYRYGMGFYSARPETMAKLRHAIDQESREFEGATAFLRGSSPFVVEGERYKRSLAPDRPQEVRDWYDRKSVYLVCNRPPDDHLFGPELVDDLIDGFSLLSPLYHYLLRLSGHGVPADGRGSTRRR